MSNCRGFCFFVRLVMFTVIMSTWILQTSCQVTSEEKFVMSHNRVTLPCALDGNYDRAEWRLNGDVITVKDISKDKKFSIIWTKHYYNLTINEATEESVGLYKCMAGELNTPVSTLMSYQLVVGGLKCYSNIDENQVLIAKSDCQNLEATKFSFDCSFTFQGEPSRLSIKWKHKWTNDSLVEFGTADIEDSVKNGNMVSIKGSVSVTPEMANQSFECFIENQPSISPCILKRTNIKYAFNSPLEKIDSARDVTCKANKSDNTNCDYSWQYKDGDTSMHRPGATLKADQMKSPGSYRCTASCSIGNHKCHVLAQNLELLESGTASTSNMIPIIVGVVALLILIVLVTVAVFCFFRKKKQKEENTKKGSEDLKEIVVGKDEKALLPKNEDSKSSIPTVPTPAPQPASGKPLAQNGGGTGAGPPQKKPSFKRFHSSKGSQEFQKIPEEDNPESPCDESGNVIVTTQIGKEIPLNDSTGSVSGVCHLSGRIYCVTKGCSKIFIFSDSPPYNRMMPEEIIVRGLSNPQSLVACRKPEHPSLYINDYGGTIVFRVFPKLKEEGNKCCQGKIDGQPAYLALARPDTLVVTLKRDQKMHTEVYDTSQSFDKDGSVSETQTWEKKYILPHPGDVTLPLGICVSGCPLEGMDVNSRGSQKLYLLYGSGRYSKTTCEFSSYKIAKLDMETGRLFVTFDLKDFSKGSQDKFVPVTLAADESEGGVFVLEANKGQLVHLNSDLARFVFDVKVGGKLQSVCVRSKERIAIFGNNSKRLFLVCHRIKHGAPIS